MSPEYPQLPEPSTSRLVDETTGRENYVVDAVADGCFLLAHEPEAAQGRRNAVQIRHPGRVDREAIADAGV